MSRPDYVAATCRPPETEGELYDRLQALVAECDVLSGVVSAPVAVRLTQAQTDALAALKLWMDES